ncbi:MAG TPA: hypothetical protein V6C69_13000 [Trichormus sp.]
MRCQTPGLAMPTLRRALIAAAIVAAMPAAALAEHFYIVHPSKLVPSAENLLFCASCVDQINDYSSTPTAEEYLIDQLMDDCRP